MTPAPQPATKPKRPWYQYSVRTILIGTAVFGMLLGVALRWVAPAQRQRAAVKAVERLGGYVEYEKVPADESWVVKTVRDWLPRDYVDPIVAVALFRAVVSDADLAPLAGCKHLRGLSLAEARVHDAAIVHMTDLKELRVLDLSDTAVTDAALANLRDMRKMTGLYLDHTQTTDRGLVHLELMSELRELDLTGTQVTDNGLASLKGFARLERLQLLDTAVSDTGIADLKTALPDCTIFGP